MTRTCRRRWAASLASSRQWARRWYVESVGGHTVQPGTRLVRPHQAARQTFDQFDGSTLRALCQRSADPLPHTSPDSLNRLCLRRCATKLQQAATATRSLCRPSADMLCGRPADLWPFALKTGTQVTPVLGNLHVSFSFPTTFGFRVRSPYGTDMRADGRARSLVRLITYFAFVRLYGLLQCNTTRRCWRRPLPVVLLQSYCSFIARVRTALK